jgi:hypothetical protein
MGMAQDDPMGSIVLGDCSANKARWARHDQGERRGVRLVAVKRGLSAAIDRPAVNDRPTPVKAG